MVEGIWRDLAEPDQMARTGPRADMLRGGLVLAMGSLVTEAIAWMVVFIETLCGNRSRRNRHGRIQFWRK